MQKSTKRLLSMLVVLALVLGFAPAGILAVETKAETNYNNWTGTDAQTKITAAAGVKTWAEGINNSIRTLTGADGTEKVKQVASAKTCPICQQTNITWVKASDANAPASGSSTTRRYTHYVIDSDITATGTFLQLNAYNTVCMLWLDPSANGDTADQDGKYTVTLNDDGYIHMQGWRGQLNIAGNANIVSNSTTQPVFSFTNADAQTALSLYGGTYRHNNSADFNRSIIRNATCKGAQIDIYNNVVIGPESSQSYNKSDATKYCNVSINYGTFNMYGGTIQNGYSGMSTHGWNVFLLGGAFNMYNGTITGGSGVAGTPGANVHVRGTFNMYGGIITGGKAGNGGNVNVYSSGSGSFTMHGGKIQNGVANAYNGGNIWIASGKTANLKGGLISGGDAVSYGGNIFVNGTANLEDIDIQNGKCATGGNIAVVSGKLTMTADTSVTGGANDNANNCSSYGGNIFLQNSQTGTLLKGTISGGRAINGGNIYATDGAKAEIQATVSEGVARFGTNVYVTTAYSDNGTPTVTTDDRNWVRPVAVTMSGGSSSGGTLNALGGGTPFAKDVYVNIGAQGQGSTLTLKGGFTAEQIVFVESLDKNFLTIDSSWTGEAGLYTNPPHYLGDPIVGGVATGELQGTLSNVNGSLVDVVYDGNGGLKLPAYQVVGTDFNQGYTDADEAVAEAAGDNTKKLVAAGDIELAGETVVIDPIKAINVTGTGIVKGMDLENNDFVGNSGSITTPATGVTVEKDVTYNGVRYIALTGGEIGTNVYTFHRLQVKLTNVTINPDKAGLYYKAEYKFDDKVAARAETYGVFVELNQAATAESENFTSANVADATIENHTLASSSHGVYGIFKATREPAANVAAGKSVINGNPYITIKWNDVDSEKYMGENVAKSMESAIQLADQKWDKLVPEAKADLNAFVAHWNDLGAFDTAVLEALTNVGK